MKLPPAQLTPSGRPQLEAGEVEKALLDKVRTEGPFACLNAKRLYLTAYSRISFRQVDLEFEGVGGVAGGTSADRFKVRFIHLGRHALLKIYAQPAVDVNCLHAGRLYDCHQPTLDLDRRGSQPRRWAVVLAAPAQHPQRHEAHCVCSAT